MTEHLEIAPDFDHPVCEGTLAALDAHVAFVEAGLSRPIPTGRKIRLYWITDDIDDWCDHRGCFYPGTRVIASNTGTIGHEMVHVIHNPVAQSNDFIGEGLAELFSGHGSAYDPRSASRPSPADLLPRTGTTDYVVAGHFMRYLYEEHGPGVVRRLADAIDGGGSVAELEDEVYRIFVMSFEELSDEFEERAPRYYRGLTGIPAPSVDPVAEGTVAVSLSCESDKTRAPLWDDSPGMYQVLAWTVEDECTVAFGVDGQGEGRVEIVEVDRRILEWERPVGVADNTVAMIEPGTSTEVTLVPSTYLLVFWTLGHEPVELELRSRLK